MAIPNLGSTSTPMDVPFQKIRKPYTITKSRETWTETESDKFLEALQRFNWDWKKFEAFIGSKTAIQIRSHAQKYFLKVQKSGTNVHLPPSRKAAHPYLPKASKNDLPDFAEVYSFIASVIDTNTTGHVQKPKEVRLLSSNEMDSDKENLSDNLLDNQSDHEAQIGTEVADLQASAGTWKHLL